MAASLDEINVISFNCWGLKYISKHRKERMEEIGYRIATSTPTPNIVGLQECWTQEDYHSIRQSVKEILPYGKFYHSGIFGGGLAILSKWPIEESSMVRYPLNGRPTAFYRGDWYVGKGVACAKLRFGPGRRDVVEVFTTHLHAPYEAEPNDSYLCHRTAQAWEISKLMNGAAERGHLVLGLGDFNMLPLSLAHRLITTHAPVEDAWRVLHPDSSIGAARDEVEKTRRRPIPTADYNILENGATCDGVMNTWRWNKPEQKRLGANKPHIDIPGDTTDPRAKRLDYVFFGFDDRRNKTSSWGVKSVKVGMMERHRVLGCSLSDHFAVEATIARAKIESQQSSQEVEDRTVSNGAFLQSPTASEHQTSISERSIAPTSPTADAHLTLATYDEILAMTAKYTLRERQQRRLRLYHFIGSVLISIGCLVAIWWSPKPFVSFILMLLSTLGLSAGVIDGLIGGLFVGSELRALKEFEWEIRNARVAAGGAENEVEFSPVKDW